eukprot:gb/GECG01010870.1/.p1 GENE.gb/GECG01010870.1/~~gb/GECG01010870.1/.p1  ORF type:complete len:858 (+),score=86.12 gb/GECG01010870.1/:1-2574(+)
MSIMSTDLKFVTEQLHNVYPPVPCRKALPEPPREFVQRKSLNMTAEYMSSSDDFRRHRELIQNWRDRCIELAEEVTDGSWQQVVTLQSETYDRGAIFALVCPESPTGLQQVCLGHIIAQLGADGHSCDVEFVNHDTILSPKVLTLGYSKKRSKSSAGQFGEGMKVEINALVANGAAVSVQTGHYSWTFNHITVDGEGADSVRELCAHARRLPSPTPETSISVNKGPPFNVDKFLFLQPKYWQYRREVFQGVELEVEVLLGADWARQVYCQGIHIMSTDSLSKTGLNFLESTRSSDLGMGRDRNSVAISHIIWHLPHSVEQLYRHELLKDGYSDGTRVFERKNSMHRTRFIVRGLLQEMSDTNDHTDGLIRGLRFSQGSQFFNILLEILQIEWNGTVDAVQEDPKRNVPVTKDSKEAKQLYYIQFPRIYVSQGLLCLLKKASQCPTLEQAWEQKKQDLLALPYWNEAGTDPEACQIEGRLNDIACRYFQLKPHQILFKKLPDTQESQSLDQIIFQLKGPDGQSFYVVNGTFLLSRPFAERVHQRQKKDEDISCQAKGGSCGCLVTAFMTGFIEAIAGTNEMERNRLNKLLLREGMAAIGRTQSSPTNALQTENRGSPIGAGDNAEETSDRHSTVQAENGLSSSHASDELEQTIVKDQRQQDNSASQHAASADEVLNRCLSSLRDVNFECLTTLCSPHPPTREITLRDGCKELVRLESRAVGGHIIQVRQDRRTPELRTDDVQAFRNLIYELLVNVFKVDPGKGETCFTIFWDDTQGTIAFNKGRGNLAFNLFYFNNRSPRRKAYQYWSIVIAHELAHNVAKNHNKEHEYAEELLLYAVMDSLHKYLNIVTPSTDTLDG